ncbi:MAG: hypothetical protein PHF46_03295 [Candidatus Gracilibacteria bacterium]|nr:hypothetical protein [Candidatus Gracilibacteria bacterium]MDD3120405.1 hypothetical protein [Candidatus Gracilibacteria bacterium]MDD4530909.1 hypothetical protein [Candidatus Gracilibacteria bacterium]
MSEKQSGLQENYLRDVIQAGDDASERYKRACIEANENSLIGQNGMLVGGKIAIPDTLKGVKIEAQIDGVGTKTQIYMKQFELWFREYEQNKDDGGALEKIVRNTTEIFERMLSDFFAMNTDDLRKGEVALGMANIMDINHLKGEKGQIFGICMANAMTNVIKRTGIAILNGETAILGNSQNHKELSSLVRSCIEQITALKLDSRDLDNIIKKIENGALQVENQIEVNLGGTVIGIETKEKLIPLADGQVIIGFQEIPTESGIIGPRSNGITLIRRTMEELLGADWPNRTFEDFKKAILEDNEDAKFEGLDYPGGMKLWDIATGKTTVYNPFISQQLLGGIEGDPVVGISGIIHGTGNPPKKITNVIGKERFDIEVDFSNLQMPPIMIMCQLTNGITDEVALKQWNMGLPYAVICNTEDVGNIIEMAKNNGIIAKKIGSINSTPEDEEPMLRVDGVGIGKSSFEYEIAEYQG